jgi:SAM-dependent methyltransferase
MAETGHSHHGDFKHDHDKHDHRHDWHEAGYVGEWVAKNQKRTERSALIQTMLAKAGVAKDAAVRVLDVGGGYGFVSGEVLKAFPKARVTLQDYSAPMIERAKDHLADHAAQMRYTQSDLMDRGWAKKAAMEGGGPFDLVVSAIAIHNLRDVAAIGACYKDIHDLLAAGGSFLNCDHIERAGGADKHVEMLREAGFKSVDLIADGTMTAILIARV